MSQEGRGAFVDDDRAGSLGLLVFDWGCLGRLPRLGGYFVELGFVVCGWGGGGGFLGAGHGGWWDCISGCFLRSMVQLGLPGNLFEGLSYRKGEKS